MVSSKRRSLDSELPPNKDLIQFHNLPNIPGFSLASSSCRTSSEFPLSVEVEVVVVVVVAGSLVVVSEEDSLEVSEVVVGSDVLVDEVVGSDVVVDEVSEVVVGSDVLVDEVVVVVGSDVVVEVELDVEVVSSNLRELSSSLLPQRLFHHLFTLSQKVKSSRLSAEFPCSTVTEVLDSVKVRSDESNLTYGFSQATNRSSQLRSS